MTAQDAIATYREAKAKRSGTPVDCHLHGWSAERRIPLRDGGFRVSCRTLCDESRGSGVRV